MTERENNRQNERLTDRKNSLQNDSHCGPYVLFFVVWSNFRVFWSYFSVVQFHFADDTSGQLWSHDQYTTTTKLEGEAKLPMTSAIMVNFVLPLNNWISAGRSPGIGVLATDTSGVYHLTRLVKLVLRIGGVLF